MGYNLLELTKGKSIFIAFHLHINVCIHILYISLMLLCVYFIYTLFHYCVLVVFSPVGILVSLSRNNAPSLHRFSLNLLQFI